MESSDLLLADADIDTHGVIFSYFKEEYNILLPSSLDQIFQQPFLNSSLAIIDYSFSENRGLEALKDLKMARPSLPVIFTTPHGTEDLCLNAFRFGARDYFRKPLVVEDIAKSMELILRYSKNKGMERTNVLLDKYSNIFPLSTTIQDVYPNVEKAKRYIEENYDETLSLDLLASVACMSKYHFCRIFKKQVGMTYTKYLNMVKIRKAKRLLKNSLQSISEICFLVGYNDITYFERVFKQLEGCCPSAYRKEFHLPTPYK